MYRFTLHPEDADRLGVPTTIELDLDRPRLSEIRAVREQVGMSWTNLLDQLTGAVPDSDRLYAAGVLYWLAAVRSGSRVAWRDFDLDFMEVEMTHQKAPEPAQGNPPAPDGA
jgi:hypothetical protein